MAGNIPTVQAICRAFGAGDLPAMLAELDADVDRAHDWGIEPLGIFARRAGRAEVPKFFAGLGALEITRFGLLNLLEGGTRVVAPVRLGATVRATGRPVNDLEAHRRTFGADGKVTGLRHICDTRQLERAGC